MAEETGIRDSTEETDRVEVGDDGACGPDEPEPGRDADAGEDGGEGKDHCGMGDDGGHRSYAVKRAPWGVLHPPCGPSP